MSATSYDDRSTYDELRCPGCGLPVLDWAPGRKSGFLGKDGDHYCCAACAEGKLCDCGSRLSESEKETHGGYAGHEPSRKAKGA